MICGKGEENMLCVSEIRCKLSEDSWTFKNCLLCEQFTSHKTPKGWTCSCALNTDPKDNYHFTAIWQTEICILAGTMMAGDRLSVHIRKAKD